MSMMHCWDRQEALSPKAMPHRNGRKERALKEHCLRRRHSTRVNEVSELGYEEKKMGPL